MQAMVTRQVSEDEALVELAVSFGSALSEEPVETSGVKAYAAGRIYADLKHVAACLNNLLCAMVPSLTVRVVADVAAVVYVESGDAGRAVAAAKSIVLDANAREAAEHEMALAGGPDPMDVVLD